LSHKFRSNHLPGELTRLNVQEWVNTPVIERILSGFAEGKTLFGDFYVGFTI
jgi:hypothetical protein